MVQRPEKQHTVPKTLLRGFVDTRSRLAVRSRSGSESRISLKKASVWPNFYSYANADGAWVDDVEDWLGKHVESPVGPVLIRARNGVALTTSDNAVLARFAASGLLRTATTRSYLEQIGHQIGPVLVLHEQLVRGEIDPVSLSPEEWSSAQAVAEAVWQRLDAPADPEKANLRIFVRKVDQLSTQLAGWAWSVRTAPTPCLITADAPVAVLPGPADGWQGILPPGSPVFIPISSRKIIIGEPHPLPTGGDLLTLELADAVNARLAFEAFESVFTDPSSPWPNVPALAPTPPTLPTPTVTWSRGDKSGDEPSRPRYPKIDDPAIRQLLDSLG